MMSKRFNKRLAVLTLVAAGLAVTAFLPLESADTEVPSNARKAASTAKADNTKTDADEQKPLVHASVDERTLVDIFAPVITTVTLESLLPPPPAPPVKAAAKRKPKKEPVAVAPPEQPAPPAPPPAPKAPDFAYKFIGSMNSPKVQDGSLLAFIESKDSTGVKVIKKGDLIDESFRVENITTEKIEIVYLPLKSNQTIKLSELKK